ncbi:unnamed protein product [Dimorphilus gyrociliatus]|uniref:Glycosyltransferase 61 catalytic domain-containing protein n=1 Tax=Dimorphilus gyrociliatus TaxID=2664684 RepID=A0A7I8VMU1_9ANNE|nr:unnamed protein product [Dimorphilus gyrociliatus]
MFGKRYCIFRLLIVCLAIVSSLCLFIQFIDDNHLSLEEKESITGIQPNKIVHDEIKSTRSELDIFVDENPKTVVYYAPYNMTKPIFVDRNDENIFSADKENLRVIGIQPRSDLLGIVAVLQPGYFFSNLQCTSTSNLADWTLSPSSPIVHNYDLVLPIITDGGCSINNFFQGILPKLIQARGWIKFKEIKFLVHGSCDPLIGSILGEFGITTQRLISFKGGAIRSERLVNTCIVPPTHPEIFKKAREILGISTSVKDANDVVLLLPSDTQLLRNANQVSKFLERRYGHRFKDLEEQYSVNQVKSSFRKAKIIIGIHNAILSNMFFAPVGCAIIEIVGTKADGTVRPANVDPRLIWHLAISMGHKYYRIIENPVSMVGSIYLTISKLEKTLNIAENQI